VTANVVAVIVTYQPDPALMQEISAIALQVSRVLVVDNGSSPDRGELIRRAGNQEKVEVIPLRRNLGVAAAHNVGIRRAREMDASHVLLLDQDSMPQPQMVENLLKAEAALSAAGQKVGALGPVYHDPRLDKSWPFYRMSGLGVRGQQCAGEYVIACDLLISSGTLLPLPVIEDVGPMNESYFLEHVDTEWSLRARSRGYGLFGVCDARMDHLLGDSNTGVPFTGRRVQIYQPYRHYYLFRNAVLLGRESYAKLPWKLNELRRLLARLIYFGLFVPPRLQRVRFMALGICHGIMGRAGPLNR
jgi:rhamnosyltransferase